MFLGTKLVLNQYSPDAFCLVLFALPLCVVGDKVLARSEPYDLICLNKNTYCVGQTK